MYIIRTSSATPLCSAARFTNSESSLAFTHETDHAFHACAGKQFANYARFEFLVNPFNRNVFQSGFLRYLFPRALFGLLAHLAKNGGAYKRILWKHDQNLLPSLRENLRWFAYGPEQQRVEKGQS
jgi:hypothetical protein